MRDTSKVNPNILEILKKQDKTIDSVNECLAKLQIKDDPAALLEEQLDRLNLEENDSGKLIPRLPIRSRDTPRHTHQPYTTGQREEAHVNEYVSYDRTCGGVVFTNNFNVHTNNFNHFNNVQAEANNVQAEATNTNDCPDCTNQGYCDECRFILEIANTRDFFDFNLRELFQINDDIEEATEAHETSVVKIKCTDKATEANVLLDNNILMAPDQTNKDRDDADKFNTVFIQIPPRRVSQDSGIQSDIASPQSDFVLSPAPNVVQPAVPDNRGNLRKLLPKPASKTSETSGSRTGSPEGLREQSVQHIMRSILNPSIKQMKWVEMNLKSDDEIFGKDKDGQTILQKLLKSNEKYIAESFYAIMVLLQQHPTKCEHIIAAESTICDTIREHDHPSIFLDYFNEALQVIHDNISY